MRRSGDLITAFVGKEPLPPRLRGRQVTALDEIPQVTLQQSCIHWLACNAAAFEQPIGIGSGKACLVNTEAANHILAGVRWSVNRQERMRRTFSSLVVAVRRWHHSP